VRSFARPGAAAGKLTTCLAHSRRVYFSAAFIRRLMPSDPGLAARVLDKLNKVETKKGDTWPILVLAALESQEALDAAIATPTPSGSKTRVKAKATAAAPQVAYLRSITVEGCRGVGKQVATELPTGP